MFKVLIWKLLPRFTKGVLTDDEVALPVESDEGSCASSCIEFAVYFTVLLVIGTSVLTLGSGSALPKGKGGFKAAP